MSTLIDDGAYYMILHSELIPFSEYVLLLFFLSLCTSHLTSLFFNLSSPNFMADFRKWSIYKEEFIFDSALFAKFNINKQYVF